MKKKMLKKKRRRKKTMPTQYESVFGLMITLQRPNIAGLCRVLNTEQFCPTTQEVIALASTTATLKEQREKRKEEILREKDREKEKKQRR